VPHFPKVNDCKKTFLAVVAVKIVWRLAAKEANVERVIGA
jgi:hypothetical protein